MKWRIYGMLLICILMIAGCGQENPPQATQNNNNQVTQVENSNPGEQQNLNNSEIATHLANIAKKVPNVENAAAVVAGPYAVVGIDVDKDLDRSRVSTIKYSVAEALYHDPYGKTTVVVADADGAQRIRGMADKIGQGYPVQGIIDELAAIVGRYMPEFPVNEDRPQVPDQNKQVIPEEEKQQLEDIEEEQSNHLNNN